MNILLTLSYKGTSYCGWQVQSNRSSIQSAVTQAIFEVTGQNVSLTGSGRTDAGVHAIGQCANFRIPGTKIPMERLPYALNAHLPADIAVTAARQVPEGFSARHDAVQKGYVYRIENTPIASPLLKGLACHQAYPLDTAAMASACRLFVGQKDFAAFRTLGSSAKTTVRHVSAASFQRESSQESSGLWTFSVYANGFLYNMVRVLAGTLISLGAGKICEADIAEMFAGGIRSRHAVTAPACGLYLKEVLYPDEALACQH